MSTLIRPFLFCAATALPLVQAPAAFAAEPAGASPLPMFLAEDAVAERRIVRRLVAGEDPNSPAMREEARQLRLLQADLLAMGHAGPLPALEAARDEEIPGRIVLERTGLGAIDPWSFLAGRTLVFKRGEE